jgi:hypothetical protein
MRPDAVFLPSQPQASSMHGRVRAACSVTEALLEVDYAAGERAYHRKQPHGRLFISRSPFDTINFATGHPKASQPRYRWDRRPDGVELGYLVDGESSSTT